MQKYHSHCSHHAHVRHPSHTECQAHSPKNHCCGQAPARPGAGFRHMFATQEERTAWLEAYLQDLEQEAKAVRERIAALESAD